MSELNIKVRKSQDNGSTFRATPDTLYMGGVGSAKVDTLHFEVRKSGRAVPSRCTCSG